MISTMKHGRDKWCVCVCIQRDKRHAPADHVDSPGNCSLCSCVFENNRPLHSMNKGIRENEWYLQSLFLVFQPTTPLYLSNNEGRQALEKNELVTRLVWYGTWFILVRGAKWCKGESKREGVNPSSGAISTMERSSAFVRAWPQKREGMLCEFTEPSPLSPSARGNIWLPFGVCK